MKDCIIYIALVFGMLTMILGCLVGFSYIKNEKDKLMIERGYILQPEQWIKVEEVKE